MPRVFLITGTSTGFGKYYAQEVLDQGDYVVATARDPSKLEFQGTTAENYLAVRLDVTDKKSIEDAFTAALAKFQRVDVVVNNAGYGLAGCFEEYTDDQIRQQFEINFFGLIDVTRTAMEVFRDRQKPQGGLIQQITSIGGQRGVPLFSVYCASKWAVEGFTEAVSHEVKPEWGIKFTLIEPGGFRYVRIVIIISNSIPLPLPLPPLPTISERTPPTRRSPTTQIEKNTFLTEPPCLNRTDWAGRSMAFAERHPAYDHMNAQKAMGKRHGNQAGDPVKGAKAMYKLASMKEPPLRVVIGSDAYAGVMNKIEQYEQNYRRFERLSNETDVDGYQAP